MPQNYSLHVRSVGGIQWRKKWSMPPNLDVAIDVDDIRMAQTHRKRDFVPMWNSLVPFLLLGILMIIQDQRKGQPLSSAFSLFVITLSGSHIHVQKEKSGYISYLRCVAKEWTRKARNVPTSGSALEEHYFPIKNSDSDLVSSVGGSLKSLTSSLDVVVKLAGAIAKAVKKQQKTDQSIAQLVQKMVDVYSFTKDVKSLPEIARVEGVISAIVQETAKCALFIREFTAHAFCC
ncbi:hypothetical protein B0H13DRAFT_1935772 [Mycena leptocephala]|nr:hypothetical protein B0H13DRAFT_1935772 [Mycena leptocephala]